MGFAFFNAFLMVFYVFLRFCLWFSKVLSRVFRFFQCFSSAVLCMVF